MLATSTEGYIGGSVIVVVVSMAVNKYFTIPTWAGLSA